MCVLYSCLMIYTWNRNALVFAEAIHKHSVFLCLHHKYPFISDILCQCNEIGTAWMRPNSSTSSRHSPHGRLWDVNAENGLSINRLSCIRSSVHSWAVVCLPCGPTTGRSIRADLLGLFIFLNAPSNWTLISMGTSDRLYKSMPNGNRNGDDGDNNDCTNCGWDARQSSLHYTSTSNYLSG